MIWTHERKARLTRACPFCGSRNIKTTAKWFYVEKYTDTGSIMMECDNCHANNWSQPMIPNLSYNDAMKMAVKKWNRRAS